jgi:dihydrofolate synthase/folylpolyglutamate synthase
MPCSEELFAAGVSEIAPAVTAVHQGEEGPISTFGAMTALFFHLGKLRQMVWQVVEVGMGGTFDATNVFAQKELVVITPISLEHTKILGNTTLEIAENKAGIIRPGCVVVLAPQKDEAVVDFIRRSCLEQGAGFVDVGSSYEIIPGPFNEHGQDFVLQSKSSRRELRLSMLGEHQLENAATAIAALDALAGSGLQLSSESAVKALEGIQVPGRMELFLDSHALTPPVVFDGAHNEDSMNALVAALKRHFPRRHYNFILGANNDKNIEDILRVIAPYAKRLMITGSVNPKAMPPMLIKQVAEKIGLNCLLFESAIEALKEARSTADGDSVICVTGSLYLVAELRSALLADSHKSANWSLLRREGSF